jgi:hypothetical protein
VSMRQAESVRTGSMFENYPWLSCRRLWKGEHHVEGVGCALTHAPLCPLLE